jgi:hypothetical protein
MSHRTVSLQFMRILLVCAALTLAGCTTFSELHYFRSDPPPGQIANYFRLQISGFTAFSSARYLSGYFDEDILNQYFGEFGQPDKGRLLPVGNTKKTDGEKPATGDAATDAAKPAPDDTKNPALVLLLSSNSDDIASQLGALAQSQEFTASLVRLVAAPRFEAADTAERKLRSDQSRGRVIAALGDQLVAGLPERPTAAATNASMLEFVNQLVADLGAPAPFKSLEEASTWLSANRARLRRGEQ